MPNCTADSMNFGRLGRRVIEANFQGGAISSDGGLVLLRQADRRIGLSKAVADVLHDPRDPDRIKCLADSKLVLRTKSRADFIDCIL